jgi:hypothetical protein
MPSQMTPHGYSKLQMFERCPKAYHFAHEMRLSSKKLALAPTFGSVLHAGREAWIKGNKNIDHALTTILSTIDGFVAEGWDNFGSDDQELRDFREYCVQAMFSYHRHYENDTLVHVPAGLEIDFDLPFGSNKLTGRLDGIVILNGLVWVDEFKTTGLTAARYLQSMQMDAKCTAYVWAARQAGFKDVQGVHLDVLVKKARKSGFEFVRDILPKTDEQILQWEKATLELFKRKAFCKASGYWPEHYHSCSNMFGNCPYIDLCRFGVTEQLINAQFVRREEVTENGD